MFVILLLNVMELLSVVRCALMDYTIVWTSIECVCCACGPSERLDAPSKCFVCVFVSEVISSFRSLRAGP